MKSYALSSQVHLELLHASIVADARRISNRG